jgi:hypothetical protein
MNVWMKSNVSQVAKVVALAAALTLAACGGEAENNDDNNTTNNTTGNNTSNNTSGTNNTNNTTGTNNSNNTSGTNNTNGGETALLQVLHLSNDANAATVDVYVNGDLLLDDLDYKEGTNFFPVPVGVELAISITPGDSTDEAFGVTLGDDALTADTNYIAIATGSLDPADAGTAQEFTLDILGDVATESDDAAAAELTIYHGALDAPAVDVVVDNDTENPAVDGFEYRDAEVISGDLGGFTLGTIGLFDIYVDANDAFFAGVQTPDLSGLNGGAALVAAIGSIAGGDFEIIAFPASVGEAPEQSAGVVFGGSARLQVIHNSPDPAAAVVDIYTDAAGLGVLLLDDFAFRDASPYISVPSGLDLAIDVTAGDAGNNEAPVFDDVPVTLDPGSTTVAIATGLVAGQDEQAFQLLAAGGQEAGEIEADETAALIVHGIPDAPEVGVGAGGASLVGDATLEFPQTTDAYVTLPASADVAVQLLNADNTAAVFETTAAVPLTAVAGIPVVVLASGTLDTEDDADPGLLVVTPAGAAGDDVIFAPLAPAE